MGSGLGGGRDVIALASHRIECPNTPDTNTPSFLGRMQLYRPTHDALACAFQCCRQGSGCLEAATRDTEKSGSHVYLDRQAPRCPFTHLMTSFRLNDGGHSRTVNHEHSCCKAGDIMGSRLKFAGSTRESEPMISVAVCPTAAVRRNDDWTFTLACFLSPQAAATTTARS
mmetsp:Transcript_8747/g.14196  ORF Transcript_8747/g.14196 Transcript_8747/m.14196 type:complete len:170 (+) Transcript_8747:9-518(+)